MNIARTKIRSLPQEISARLRALRGRITRWVLVKGLSRWLVLVLAIIVIDIFIDRTFKLDFPQRAIMLVVMFLLVAGLFLWRVIRPMLGRISDDALLHEIEIRHPELQESLISGAQLSRDSELESKGISMELAKATIDRSIELARKMDFQGTVDRSKFAKNAALLCGGLILAIGLAVGITQSRFLSTWFNRNVLLADDQWPQATYLKIVGADSGVLVLPRGTDHRLIVQVTEESRNKDVAVTLEIEGANGQTFHSMKPTGKLAGREHSFVMHNVSSEVVLRATGGDDVTPKVSVKLVEPPAILDLAMRAVLPDYTKMEPQALEGPGPHSVLAGSRIEATALVNKPLSSFSIASDNLVATLVPGDKPDNYSLNLPGENGELVGGQYEFKLIDESGLASTRRTRMVINIKEDGPPKVLASLLGISGLAVPRVRVPVSYNTRDEYGLSRINFHTNWKNVDQEGESQKDSTKNIKIAQFDVREKAVRQKQDVSVLDLEPLKLKVGASFRLLVRATDSLPGEPNIADSTEFLLRIVSIEELRADLLRREIEQRKAFQRSYDAQLEIMGELEAVSAMQRSRDSQEKFDADQQARLISLSRDQKLIGTNVTAIANRFEEFLVETQNNRLDEEAQEFEDAQTFANRFDDQIIRPIRILDSELIATASRNLDNCRRLVSDRSELSNAAGATMEVQQRILGEMKNIMSAMEESENFQEAVNKLLEIKRGESQIKDEIKKRRLNQKDIFDEEDIFDDE